MPKIMLSHRRLTQHPRNATRRARPVCPGRPPCRRPAALPVSWPAVPAATPAGFTLIEMLIVIGLLGAVAMILLASFNTNREQTLDHSIVQKELSDLQRAFHRMAADCVLQQGDLEQIAQFGLALLMERVTDNGTVLAEPWDVDKGKGWRGPYVEPESHRLIAPSSVGQQSGAVLIPVIETPYSKSDADGSYYRLVATDENALVTDTAADIDQLWVVSPDKVNDPGNGNPYEVGDPIECFPYRRRLLLDRD